MKEGRKKKEKRKKKGVIGKREKTRDVLLKEKKERYE